MTFIRDVYVRNTALEGNEGLRYCCLVFFTSCLPVKVNVDRTTSRGGRKERVSGLCIRSIRAYWCLILKICSEDCCCALYMTETCNENIHEMWYQGCGVKGRYFISCCTVGLLEQHSGREKGKIREMKEISKALLQELKYSDSRECNTIVEENKWVK